jgi:hypothetical protein
VPPAPPAAKTVGIMLHSAMETFSLHGRDSLKLVAAPTDLRSSAAAKTVGMIVSTAAAALLGCHKPDTAN